MNILSLIRKIDRRLILVYVQKKKKKTILFMVNTLKTT